MKKVSSNKVFGGEHAQYTHWSQANNCEMTFAVFLPPQANDASAVNKVPSLYWLSGLTCTDQNFMQKAGAFKKAAELGIAIIAPDTSPRGDSVPDDENQAYDLGLGAGFYLNATEAPWKEHYNMYDYIVQDLISDLEKHLNLSTSRAISGHSMGGHGALTIGLKHPELFRSISAFSPICNPVNCPWGQKAFTAYLGQQQAAWSQYDACHLLETAKDPQAILIDQGSADDFLDEQLRPERLQQVAQKSGFPLKLHFRDGYDHSYFFISSFIEEHLDFHAKFL